MKLKVIIVVFINLFGISCNQEANRNQRLKDLLIGEWEFCREEPKYAEDEEIPLDFYQPIGIEFFQDSIEFFNGFFQTYKEQGLNERGAY